MTRWVALAIGVALVAVAFAAGSRVADTREGLIAEVITLFAGLIGISLVLYGLFAGSRPRPRLIPQASAPAVAVRPGRELAMGGGGLALAAVLVGGLGLTAGWRWAALGLVLLLPMIAGSAYLCARYLRVR
jgi:hypothetical protein